MTEHLPDEITYGFVADRVLLAVGDTTDDTDRFPDGVPAKGTVTFTPERDTHYTQQTPATVLQQPIECIIYQGDPDDPEEPPDRVGMLVDPAGHVGNVALIVGWYSVSYRLDRGAAKRFRFQVLPEHTADEPLWLSSVAPLTPSPSERFVVNEAVYNDTLAARDQTEQYRDKTLEYRNQAQTARTGAETAETNAKTHATDAGASASTAADILAASQALGITVDTSVGTRVFVGDTMIHGETPLRHIQPNTNWEGGMLMYRENNMVYLQVDITKIESTSSRMFSIPTGFRTTDKQPAARPILHRVEMGDTGTTFRTFFVGNLGAVWNISAIAEAGRLAGIVSWYTDDPWPTSLPGTPA